MDKIDKEYYKLLKRHLAKAYDELQELQEKIDRKIVEINEIEEIIDTIEHREDYKYENKI